MKNQHFLGNVWMKCILVCGLVANLQAESVTPTPLRN